jgi:anti-sigma regulatory factor (Ser/Thr protein kinase)
MGTLLAVQPDAALEQRLAREIALGRHTVELSNGVANAIALMRRRPVDVLVTPSMSIDDDLALAVEGWKARPDLRVIALAPSVSHADLIASLRARVFALFTEPLDYAEILSMANAAFDAVDWRDTIEVVSAMPQWMTLRVSCQLVAAERVIRFMTEHESALPTGERDLLMAAFREILVNAMEHGGGFDPGKVIEVTAARTERAIVYHFRDPGGGFNRAGLEHAAATSSPEAVMSSAIKRAELGMRPGGFGMLIVRQIVDEVVYNESGNEVLLIKHLS